MGHPEAGAVGALEAAEEEAAATLGAAVEEAEGALIAAICRSARETGSATDAATRTLPGATSAIGARSRNRAAEEEEEGEAVEDMEAIAEDTAEDEGVVVGEVDMAVTVVIVNLDRCEEGECLFLLIV